MYGSWVLVILILVSSLPVIAVYIWFRIAKYQFSLNRFFFALLAGAAAFFPALILQGLLPVSLTPGRAALFYDFFVRIAFTEEISRLLMLFIFFLISSKLKPPAGPGQLSYNAVKMGTAVGLVVGLGFSILENATYAASDIRVLLLRVVTAAAIHGACGSRVGAAAVMFRSNPIQALFRVFIATAIHGVYNIMVTIPGISSLAAVLLAASAFATAILAIKGGWTNDESAPNPANQGFSGEGSPPAAIDKGRENQ
jgi:RsiW-degrading membrane proteinase PrsW (M82 family)